MHRLDFKNDCAHHLGLGDWQRVLEDDSIQESLQELGPHVYKLVMNACHKRLLCENATKDDALNSPNPGSLPMSITVAGAGITEANGVYVRASGPNYIFDPQNPFYTKDEYWIHGQKLGSSEQQLMWGISHHVRTEGRFDRSLLRSSLFFGPHLQVPSKDWLDWLDWPG